MSRVIREQNDFTNLIAQTKTKFHKREILEISSNPALGARLVSQDGSEFTIILQQPIFIDSHAENVTIEVNRADIWHTVPNLYSLADSTPIILQNNLFCVDDGVLGMTTITIPTGQYNIDTLSSTINNLMVAAGFAANLVTLVPNEPERKVIIEYGAIGVIIDFDDGTCPNSIRHILGFDSATLPASTSIGQQISANSLAKFNNVNGFHIHSDLNSTSLRLNDEFVDIIAAVPIQAIPQDLIAWESADPNQITADNLLGKRIDRIRFYLTDENNIPANTGEFWSATITFRWWI